MKTGNKIVIVGAGYVGVSFAYQALSHALCKELVIVDIDEKKALGEVIDLNHGIPFVSSPTKITAGNYSDCHDADIVVITAGRGQREGETRLDLLNSNARIIKSIVSEIMKSGFDGIMIVASNPVDILAHLAWKYSGLPKSRVFGTGTWLDTARLKHLIGEKFNIYSNSVHTLILGEHGDSEFPVWSYTTLYGKNIDEFIEHNPTYTKDIFYSIFDKVKNSAYEIIKLKGATNFAIGLALVKICDSIFTNKNIMLPLSVLCEGEYGLNDIHIGLPCILNRNGIRQVVQINLNDKEKEQLKKSASNLNEELNKIAI